ncbi:MAG: SPOR domain-containing protein [Legionella sp.]|nr:MAG: SPOR domain-containing protein [Legionella sp.]
MARDYGNRRSGHQKNSGPHQFLVVVVTFLLGYLTATVFDIQTVSHWMNTQVLNSEPSKPQPQKPVHAEIPPKPKFEFYTLLANEKGGPGQTQNKPVAATTAAPTPTVPTATQQAAAATGTLAQQPLQPTQQSPTAAHVAEGKPLAPTQATSSKGAFVVQVASFKARKDAEQMKGMLTLKGFDVKVVPVTNANGNWFRVVIGPFPSRQSAQQAQISIAKTEHLNGMVTPARG